MVNPSTPAAGWHQGALIDLSITALNQTGDGVGRYQDRVVFVPDTVPGDRLVVRLIRIKNTYGFGQIHSLAEPSPQRVRPACVVADKCGGCQWQHIDPACQMESKQQQIIDALERIGGFKNLPLQPFLPSPQSLGYRNKVTYPLARSQAGQVQAGYYRRGTHKLVNLNQCPVQDERLNPLLVRLKQDIGDRGWSIYDEAHHRGKLRHLGLRIGQRTGEILVTLISAHPGLPGLEEQAQQWLAEIPGLVGVCLNLQPRPNNCIFGPETRLIAGRDYCLETFADLTFALGADTFFQVNTAAAEALLHAFLPVLDLSGQEVLWDAYCGVGTFTLPLAQRVYQAIAVEINDHAVHQAQNNAARNSITNVTFVAGSVETFLPTLGDRPDLILLDPPRKGCSPEVLDTLLAVHPPKILYISCQPPTLARDLRQLCEKGNYALTWVQGCDFFPQTPHVECAVILEHRP